MRFLQIPIYTTDSNNNVIFTYYYIVRVMTIDEAIKNVDTFIDKYDTGWVDMVSHTGIYTTAKELFGIQYISVPVSINPLIKAYDDTQKPPTYSIMQDLFPKLSSNVYERLASMPYDDTATSPSSILTFHNSKGETFSGSSSYIRRDISTADYTKYSFTTGASLISGTIGSKTDTYLAFSSAGNSSSTSSTTTLMFVSYIEDSSKNIIGKVKLYQLGGFSRNSTLTDKIGYIKVPKRLSTSSTETLNNFDTFLLSGGTEVDPSNPYSQGGTSTGGGGGEGTFDKESEVIPSADLPSYSATESGFCSLYSPTLAQLKNLSSYMWSDAFDITKWKSIFANPIDAILGLSIVPVQPTISGSKEITIGSFETGVYANAVSNQYMTFDCGTLKIEEYWGSFMDYAPYTKSYIYLPYIGMRQLDTDEIMKKSVNVLYKIDLLSGACVSQIICDGSVLYQFAGQISAQIPVTSVSYNNMYRSLANLISTGVQFVGGMALGAATSGASTVVGQVATGVVQGALQSDTSVGEVVGNVMNLKPTVTRSGGINGACGILGNQIPYIILERPNQCVADNQNQYIGYPSNTTNTLGDLSGFTQVQNVHLKNLTATQEERDEIYTLLQQGVII